MPPFYDLFGAIALDTDRQPLLHQKAEKVTLGFGLLLGAGKGDLQPVAKADGCAVHPGYRCLPQNTLHVVDMLLHFSRYTESTGVGKGCRIGLDAPQIIFQLDNRIFDNHREDLKKQIVLGLHILGDGSLKLLACSLQMHGMVHLIHDLLEGIFAQ